MAELFDHSPFVELHAALLEMLDRQAAETEIEAQLAAMQKQLQAQFAQEEAAMLAAQFDPLADHKKDHDQALGRLSARIALWHEAKDRQALLEYLEGPFSDWFVRHVNTRDFITARRMALGV